MTVAEVSAVGLPAIYVPLPHGNGEQALNARPVVDAGGGMLVADADLTGETVSSPGHRPRSATPTGSPRPRRRPGVRGTRGRTRHWPPGCSRQRARA